MCGEGRSANGHPAAQGKEEGAHKVPQILLGHGGRNLRIADRTHTTWCEGIMDLLRDEVGQLALLGLITESD